VWSPTSSRPLERRTMKVIVFTATDLAKLIVSGWNLRRMAEGKIGTLTGKSVSLEIDPSDTWLKVKQSLEDREGWAVGEQVSI
jgi:hypothetical protein